MLILLNRFNKTVIFEIRVCLLYYFHAWFSSCLQRYNVQTGVASSGMGSVTVWPRREQRAQWQSSVSPWHHTEKSKKPDPLITKVTQRDSSFVHTIAFSSHLIEANVISSVCVKRSAWVSGKRKGRQMVSVTAMMMLTWPGRVQRLSAECLHWWRHSVSASVRPSVMRSMHTHNTDMFIQTHCTWTVIKAEMVWKSLQGTRSNDYIWNVWIHVRGRSSPN